MALAQQTMLRAYRLESGLFANCLEMAINNNDTPISRWSPTIAGDLPPISETTRAQNRNYALGDGFERMAKQSNAISLLLRYKAQTERLYRRAVEEFDRLKALRAELRNEAISELQPEEDEPPCPPPDEPVSSQGGAGDSVSPAFSRSGLHSANTAPLRSRLGR